MLRHKSTCVFGGDFVNSHNELPIPSSQEAETIRRAQRGDAKAFEQLYRWHSPRVFALCLRMLKNTAEAEDLAQETFLTVFRAIRTFRGHSAFSSWLHRVTTNCVLMHLRKKVLVQVPLEEVTARVGENGSLRREPGQRDPRLLGLLDRLSIEKALAQLPERLRGTFVLYDFWGCDHQEIADRLSCSTGTSKSQLHKARRRLRQLLPSYQAGVAAQAQPGNNPALQTANYTD
jgi:RNA polymerase sigma-70 factor, ECF subfamily